uniref:CHK domain-containing protein n=1 Tax=Parastrongyloides trichosuri TaxID=131310 RepID=A0A0N4ZYE0_PARTI
MTCKIEDIFIENSSIGDFIIEKTDFSLKFVVECLLKECKRFQRLIFNNKIQSIDVNQIGEGKGFISYVYRISLKLTNESTFNFILKYPTSKILNEGLGDNELISKEEVSAFHNNECYFYNLFSQISTIKLPKLYYSQEYIINVQDGLILMEDLSNTSTHVECYRSFNLCQIKNIFEEILKLQLISIEKIDGKIFEKLTKTILDTDFPFFTEFATKYWKKLTEILPESLYEHLEEPLMNLISNWKEISVYNAEKFKEIDNNISVLCHGDMWNNNILFSLDDNGDPSNEVRGVIDWQALQTSSTGMDLARTLIYCTDTYIRKEAEEELLKKFYNNLIETTNISYDLFLINYKNSFIEMSLMFLMNIGFSLNGCDMPSVSGDKVWDARKFNIGIRIINNINDAINYTKELHPEWLSQK